MPGMKRSFSLSQALSLVLCCLISGACASRSLSAHASEAPLETVPFVDLNRYLGTWYEIASFYQRFQKDCVATKATYTLRDEETIDVLNECRIKSFDGKLKTAKGTAKVVDKETNAKLKVTFFWPFYGKYWIIDLGKDYEYAVVGHPNREYLWILSRTPTLKPEVLNAIRARIRQKGFDLEKLNMTPQPER